MGRNVRGLIVRCEQEEQLVRLEDETTGSDWDLHSEFCPHKVSQLRLFHFFDKLMYSNIEERFREYFCLKGSNFLVR
jgi:hypothetical protein